MSGLPPSRSCYFICGLDVKQGPCSNGMYLGVGAPLLAGVAIFALRPITPVILPVGLHTLVTMEFAGPYSGLPALGGFVLYGQVQAFASKIESNRWKNNEGKQIEFQAKEQTTKRRRQFEGVNSKTTVWCHQRLIIIYSCLFRTTILFHPNRVEISALVICRRLSSLTGVL